MSSSAPGILIAQVAFPNVFLMTESPPTFRVLLVDDNPAIHSDFRKILWDCEEHGSALDSAEEALFDQPPPAPPHARFEIDSAHRGEDALALLRQALLEGKPYALAFIDVRMPPGWDGVETVERLWEADPSLQAVICTAYSDYSWRAMAGRLGASDSLIVLKKPFDSVEVLQLAHALTNKWNLMQQAQGRLATLDHMVRERTMALEEANIDLRRSESRFSTAFQASPIPLAIQTCADNRLVDVNAAFIHLTGFSREELLENALADLSTMMRPDPAVLLSCGGPESAQDVSSQLTTRTGATRPALLSYERIQITGEPHLLILVQDVSERQHLESQVRQSQKMEAIGQLAAGIAHDFNNLLTIIQGHSSLQLAMPGHGDDLVSSLREIEQAAERAAELTRQLLAFSRRQIIRPQVLDLSAVLRNLDTLLRRIIGEGVELLCHLPEGLPAIHADLTGIEQVVMNLVMNARDAMQGSGCLTITTSTLTTRPEERLRNPDAEPGVYVCVSVSDSGVGMDEGTRARIFEPFFTTKEVNKGNGMGLATVYGIARQHRGWVDVTTAPGQGSIFRVCFPVTDLSEDHFHPAPFPPACCEGQHTILIVEDDEAVRGLVREVLLHTGYRVLEADSADSALLIWKSHRDEIDLLLTDVVMPGSANGLGLAQALLEERPELKVIYTSGYSSDLVSSTVRLQDGVNYLPKPYLSSKLTRMLEDALISLPVPTG